MAHAQHLPPAPGRELRIGPARLMIKIDPSVTPSRLFAFESTLPPGAGMPYLHLHRDQEEVFYVLEGTIEYVRGGQTVLATPGSVVQVPPGVAHRFRNPADAPARHLALVLPGVAGQRMMDAVAQVDLADPGAVDQVLRRHDSELVTADPSWA